MAAITHTSPDEDAPAAGSTPAEESAPPAVSDAASGAAAPPDESSVEPAPADTSPAEAAADTDGPPAPATPDSLRRVIEALLFVSPEPLTLDRLTGLLGLTSVTPVREALAALDRLYAERQAAVRVVQVAGGYQLLTEPDVLPYLLRLRRARQAVRLTRQARDTLAIIAYKQPLTRSEVDAVRGANSSHHLRTLMERDLVKVVGRKNAPGAPVLYGTTKAFLILFGLRSLRDLPVEPEFIEADMPDVPTGGPQPLYDAGALYDAPDAPDAPGPAPAELQQSGTDGTGDPPGDGTLGTSAVVPTKEITPKTRVVVDPEAPDP